MEIYLWLICCIFRLFHHLLQDKTLVQVLGQNKFMFVTLRYQLNKNIDPSNKIYEHVVIPNENKLSG